MSDQIEPTQALQVGGASGSGEVDNRLRDLIAKVKAVRGTPQQWVERSLLVTRFIAALQESSRVFCRGEVHLPDQGHFPAVLTYNTVSGQTKAWAPSGRKNAMQAHHEAFFWSSIPHHGIALEVLLGPETVTQPPRKSAP